MKKLITFSGGMDSLAIMLEYRDKYGAGNIVSLGFNYGQRHFKMENDAAERFCTANHIERIVLDVPIGQIGGCSLVDHSIPVTNDMAQQRSTVVPMRNAIFMMLAAAVAQVKGCDVITHGACKEDEAAYRDCRPVFFKFLNMAIQAGLTSPINGSEYICNDLRMDTLGTIIPESKLDIKIETPLILESKATTMARILKSYDVSIYEYSYSCYNGGEKQCGECPACQERKAAFEVNNVVDPVGYKS
jgi:7-cyano-7-deazaguanine synthase